MPSISPSTCESGENPKQEPALSKLNTMIRTLNRMLGIGSALLIAVSAFAQTFDVVSIKPNTSGARETALRPDPSGRLVAINVTARMLLRAAFDDKSVYGMLPDFRLVGGPDWLATDRFDIQAQPERPIRPKTGVQQSLRCWKLDFD